jgi:energy-coupling factor transport system ATP-binding protein
VSAISIAGVSFEYPDTERAALHGADLEVEPGELLLVIGASGSGKSTLLRTVNGLVPHASGGKFAGDVVVFGRSTRTHHPRELADVVGFVAQDPEAQFVVDHVERDIAFVLENLGFSPEAMRRRVEEVLDALGIAHLRDRDPTTLSGGERQRCAIAGALAASPSALVLDEPTSQLDPQGADDVLAALTRLNHDLGTTVVLAEHRLERAAPLADRAVVVADGRVGVPDRPEPTLAGYPGAPSVTRLGRVLGWDPPPLTVRDARAFAARTAVELRPPDDPPVVSPGAAMLRARGVHVELGGREVLHGVDLTVHQGDVLALFGRNGSGKTTLLRALAGLVDPSRGAVEGHERAAYVPQNPNTLLFAPTVRRELESTLRLLGRAHDDSTVDHWLDALHLRELASRHPRSLSGGERQRVAIGAVAVGGAPVLLLDEPTRGMDAWSRQALEHAVHEHALAGGAVVLATHDVELSARCATRAVVLGDGDVVADGDARHVLAGSLFAPQVLRVLPPYLTVEEVEAELARSEGRQ